MIALTPLFSRYKDSFLLYAFRHLDRMRVCRHKQLAEILSTEMTYLYNIACIITYKDVQEKEIEDLKKWVLQLPDTFDLEQMQVLFTAKTEELNLRAFQPRDYNYSFTTVWDTIHFLCMIIDDMVNNRNTVGYKTLTNNLSQLKAIFYNLFLQLECALCRDHYITVKGFLIFNIERIETCLNQEQHGDKIVFVNEITVKNETQNVLMRNGMLYASMVFHNHINQYKYVQQKIQPPTHLHKMKWNEYKKLLEINNTS
ncbi:P33 [Chrysodeixis includens nucleopolyhedrovirus]|uniref:P33 n=1 Tax=Chrysodeixis includens nucleopolyhedrovirus TaxID=1207438 RepID=A0A5B8YT18_9ABAC|nr:P33 [Chrysodeixis includens nucleopolyhedrovirus]QED40602.1 P33 [Chrysodeixis includens nucleopolyhedrovirus]